MSKVCIFLADGFEEIEGLTVVDLLRRAGISIVMVSIMETKHIIGAHQISIDADEMFDRVDYSGMDMLILPGGMPGTKYLSEHEGLASLLKQFNQDNKWIAAICAAPSVLGKYDILKGKRATCYPGFEEKLMGAHRSNEKVILDQNVITGKGMGVAIEFSLKIIETLLGKASAEEIAEAIQFN